MRLKIKCDFYMRSSYTFILRSKKKGGGEDKNELIKGKDDKPM